MSKDTAFPGWYVEFQAAALRQLPRPEELTPDIAQGWTSNQASLKRVLAETLVPPNAQGQLTKREFTR